MTVGVQHFLSDIGEDLQEEDATSCAAFSTCSIVGKSGRLCMMFFSDRSIRYTLRRRVFPEALGKGLEKIGTGGGDRKISYTYKEAGLTNVKNMRALKYCALKSTSASNTRHAKRINRNQLS